MMNERNRKRSFGVNPAEIKQRWIDEELMARGWGWGLGGGGWWLDHWGKGYEHPSNRSSIIMPFDEIEKLNRLLPTKSTVDDNQVILSR